MKDLMTETWLLEEEESKKATLSLPCCRSAPGGGIIESIPSVGTRVYVVPGNNYKVCQGLPWFGVGSVLYFQCAEPGVMVRSIVRRQLKERVVVLNAQGLIGLGNRYMRPKCGLHWRSS